MKVKKGEDTSLLIKVSCVGAKDEFFKRVQSSFFWELPSEDGCFCRRGEVACERYEVYVWLTRGKPLTPGGETPAARRETAVSASLKMRLVNCLSTSAGAMYGLFFSLNPSLICVCRCEWYRKMSSSGFPAKAAVTFKQM